MISMKYVLSFLFYLLLKWWCTERQVINILTIPLHLWCYTMLRTYIHWIDHHAVPFSSSSSSASSSWIYVGCLFAPYDTKYCCKIVKFFCLYLSAGKGVDTNTISLFNLCLYIFSENECLNLGNSLLYECFRVFVCSCLSREVLPMFPLTTHNKIYEMKYKLMYCINFTFFHSYFPFLLHSFISITEVK